MSGGYRGTRGWVLAVLVCAPLLAGPQCGADIEEGELGEPCTRTVDCAEDLRCLAGSCQREGQDAGTDAATDSGTDAATDAGMDSGTGAATDSGTDSGADAATDSGADAT